MRAEIVPVGTEILLGNIIDLDSSFLANQLALLGIDLYFISAVGDNRRRLVETLKRACERAELVVVTGGLGPTQDDITREAIAELLGEELEIDQELWDGLQALFRRYPGKVPQSNMRQAAIIPSAHAIANSMGTAPGWWVEKDDRVIIALPGPPDEMKSMWQKGVLPRLQQRVTGAIILSRTLKTFRLAEARVGELMASLSGLANPTLATYIHPDGVHLRITAKGGQMEEAEHLVSQTEARIREALAEYVWGVDDDTLSSVVGGLLRARNLSLATMESCTEGLLCSTIGGEGESRDFFKGGLLACCDEAKMAYGVDCSVLEQHGAESIGVAGAMAETARRKLRADIGVSIGGDLRPDTHSGSAFAALSSDRFERTATHMLRGDLWRMKQRAVYATLFDLREILLEEV